MKPVLALKLTRKLSRCTWPFQFRRSLTEVHPSALGSRARDSTRNTFARQSVPMTWDFAEMNVLLDGTGTLSGAVQWTSNSLSGLHPASLGEVVQMDAREAGARMAGKVH